MTKAQIFWFVAEGLKAFTPIAIGGLAIYIASQQSSTARRKLNYDLFDRRFAVYDSIRRILTHLPLMRLETETIIEIRQAAAQARFLFEPEIRKFIEELESRATALERIHKQADHLAKRVDQGASAQSEAAEHREWFIDVAKTLGEQFDPYLDFRNIN
jgi:hypothetical protein